MGERYRTIEEALVRTDARHSGDRSRESIIAQGIENHALLFAGKISGVLRRLGVHQSGEIPSVSYVDDYSEFNRETLGMVESEIGFWENIISLPQRDILRRDHQTRFGLVVSNEAVEESLRAFVNGELGNLIKDRYQPYKDLFRKRNSEILLFKPIVDYLDILGPVIAHEFWHLVERDNGVNDEYAAVREGTATYVMNLLFGKMVEKVHNPDNLGTIVYNNMAYLIQEEVEDDSNPLRSLLDKRKRIKFNELYRTHIQPELTQLIINQQNDPQDQKQVGAVFRTLPAFKDFQEDPSLENLLAGYRKIGCNRLVDEIQGQDLERFYAHHRGYLQK